jgi:hypothetical protein
VTGPPIWVFPSQNVTSPAGVPVPAVIVTVAVRVTVCPTYDGLSDDTSDTVGVEGPNAVARVKRADVTRTRKLVTTQVKINLHPR